MLARFDGAEWTTYDWPFASTSHSYDEDPAVGPDGTLWVSSAGRLSSYDGTTWSVRVATTAGPSPGRVDVAPDGTVWYGDADGLHTLTP